MSKKSRKKPQNKKSISRETVIIAGLICFVAGYATHSLVISYNNFGKTSSSGQPISQQNFNNSQQESQASPAEADDSALLKKVEEKPDDPLIWAQLGNLYFDTGNYEKAIRAYNKSLEFDPSNPDVTTDLGIMYRRTGQLAEAVKSFKKAREINPTHEMAAFNMGIVFYYDMQNVDGAIDIWKELLNQNPDFLMPNGQKLFNFLQTIN